MFGYNSKVTVINLTIKNIMKEKVDIDSSVLAEWDSQPEEYVTSIVRELSKYLYPTPIIEILDKETAGDQHFKVDIIMTIPECDGQPERIIAFQCKSCEQASIEFLDKYTNGVYYKGKQYECPGVYWNESKSLNEVFTWEQLKVLGEFVGAVIHPDLIEALNLLKHLEKVAEKDRFYTYLEYKRFYKLLTPDVWDALQRFKVVTIGGGRILLNL